MPCCNPCLKSSFIFFSPREMTEFAVSFWAPVHAAGLVWPPAEDYHGLEKCILLIKKESPIILKYQTLVGKRELGRLRNSHSHRFSSLEISQWQTQQLICPPGKICLLTVVTVQGVQHLKPSWDSVMLLPSWQLSTKQPLTHYPPTAGGWRGESGERKVKLNCGSRWINNQNKVKYNNNNNKNDTTINNNCK